MTDKLDKLDKLDTLADHFCQALNDDSAEAGRMLDDPSTLYVEVTGNRVVVFSDWSVVLSSKDDTETVYGILKENDRTVFFMELTRQLHAENARYRARLKDTLGVLRGMLALMDKPASSAPSTH